MKCGWVLGHLRDGKTAILCMLAKDHEGQHVAHIREER